jgi:hypothetical protein
MVLREVKALNTIGNHMLDGIEALKDTRLGRA